MVQWEKDTNKALEKDCQTAAAAFGRLEKGSTRIRPRQYADLRSCHIWLEAPPYPMEKKERKKMPEGRRCFQTCYQVKATEQTNSET